MAGDYIADNLTFEQMQALSRHCRLTGKEVLHVAKTYNNVYAKLVLPGQYTETRYWYIPKGTQNQRKPYWKKVG